MISSKQLKLIKKQLEKECTDDLIIRSVCAIVKEIKDGVWHSSTSMGLYTVGEVKAIEGFHCSELLINDMIGVYIARCVRHSIIDITGRTPELIEVAGQDTIINLLMSSNTQQLRCIPKVVEKLIAEYGRPEQIDHAALEELASRAARILSQHHLQ